MSTGARLVPRGDSTIVVELGEADQLAANARAVALASVVKTASISGVLDVVPTFRTVAVYFDPLKADISELWRVLGAASAADPPTAHVSPSTSNVLHRIPVTYGGSWGPDLVEVAAVAGLSEEAVIALHSTPEYRVFMLGFIPGFAYMGPVAPAIALPRRTVPRAAVRAGSVGIAGGHTGIYPSESPGGWHVIGRTLIKPFDPERSDPFLFSPGDRVQFYAVQGPA